MKLRGGGVVDSEDLRRGWLVGRLVGKHSDLDDEEDEESAPGANGSAGAGVSSAGGRKTKGWGKRGISVSADDGVKGDDAKPLTNPEAFEDLDDDDDDDDAALPGPASSSRTADHEAVGDGSEWVDDEHAK